MSFLSQPQPLLVIAGATASGKSALTVKLCEELVSKNIPAEILCADSITVYRGFEIGAAKPSAEEQASIPHHLLNLCEPNENFTAGDFVEEAQKVLTKLHAQNILPVLVGGTGFYLRALIQGMTPESPEQSERAALIKAKLEARLQEEGISTLYQEMLGLDPALKTKIHENDHYRVVRALQAMEISGTRWSEMNEQVKQAPPRYGNCKYFCLEIPREILKTRIEARTKKMLEAGLLTEVKALLEKGVNALAKPMQSVGYKEAVDFLQRGGESLETLQEAIVRETMRLAKSQNTFFRGERNITWINGEKEENALAAIRTLLDT